jgi:DNA-binding NarL/FixJ family response regulator
MHMPNGSRTPAPITVGIIEPQRLFAPYLSQLLSAAGFSVISSLEWISLEELGRSEPRVIFIDADFIDIEPVHAIRQLAGLLPQSIICAYTRQNDPAWAARCIQAGAQCIISKLRSAPEIITGLRCALRDGTFVDTSFADETFHDDSPERKPAATSRDL